MIKRNFHAGFSANVNSVVYQTDKQLKSRDFLVDVVFTQFKNMHFPRNETDFENRLKHQVEINLCTFLDLELQDHNLQSLVSPYCNREFSPISHTSGFGIKFKISIKRYFWDECHPSECYRRHPVMMLNRQKFQCRTTDNYVYRAEQTLYID